MIYIFLGNLLGKFRNLISILIVILFFGSNINIIFAQQVDSVSVLYVPLIGITSVPNPLALPNGEGDVTYNYAVKNFLREASLTDVQVSDDKCRSVNFVSGDDNADSKLDYSETWRYVCNLKISTTTQSIATAIGTANNIIATHKAYATVVVGSNDPAPLISIINITKVAYPLSLPVEGGVITYTYKVNNPGLVPLSDVVVTDNKCSAMSGKLGDTNGNNLLDINEVWLYTCTTTLKQTTTNTVSVAAFANGLRAIGEATITVKVDIPVVPGFPEQTVPSFPETGSDYYSKKIVLWEVLAGILVILILILIFTKKNKFGKKI